MNKHNIGFDVLRIIACFFVIVNHTLWDVVEGVTIQISEGIAISLYTLSKIAVPLFLMMSGALLFQKEYTLRQIYRQKVGKLILVVLLFSYGIWVGVFENGWNPIPFLAYVYEQPILPAYWYVYTLLGIYIVLPILYRLFHAMKKQDFHYVFGLALLFLGVLPYLPIFLSDALQITKSFHLPMIVTDVVYLAFGYYVMNFGIPFSSKHKKRYCLGIFCVSLVISSAYAIIDIMQGASYIGFDNTQIITVMLMAASLFCLLYDCSSLKSMKDKTKNCLKHLGASTFGIYLSHGIVISIMRNLQLTTFFGQDRLLDTLIFELLVFFLSFLFVQLLGCVPLFRDLLHLPPHKSHKQILTEE